MSCPEDPPFAAAPAAHRRLGLVALTFAFVALSAVLFAVPVATALHLTVASSPKGGAQLLEPGGLMLLEAVRVLRRSAMPLAFSSAILAGILLAFSVAPYTALIAGLTREGRLSRGFVADQVHRHAATLGLLWLTTLLAQGMSIALVVLLGGRLVESFALVPPPEDVAFVVVFAVAIAVAAILGVVRDLAWVAAVRGDLGFYSASLAALRCARHRGLVALWACGWRWVLGVAALALTAWLTRKTSTATALGSATRVLLHQAGVATAVFARASWLAAGIRLVVPAPRPSPSLCEEPSAGPVSSDPLPAPPPLPAESDARVDPPTPNREA